MPFCSAFSTARTLSSSSLTILAASSSTSSFRASLILSLRERVRAAPQVLEHALQLLGHFLHAGRRHDLHADRHGADFDLDLPLVELALAQHLSKALPGVVVARRAVRDEARAPGLGARQQHIQHAVLGGIRGTVAHLGDFLFAGHFHGDLDKIADDRVYFAANIAHFSEFRRLDLDERRLRQARQPPGDLGLADARGSDHQDVLRRDLGAQGRIHLPRRQRLRRAMATARLAAFWPTMCLSSSSTISRGVICDTAL